MKSQFLYLVLAIGIIFTQSCDEIDNLSGGASAPEVTYSATTYEAEFFKAGNSATPSIDWNGSQGTVSLGSMVDGLSVNSTTGQLQWTKLLPPGTHDVEVVVTNSEGQVVVPMTISNALRGKFAGQITEGSTTVEGDVEFLSDGTVTLTVPSAAFAGSSYTMLNDGAISVPLEEVDRSTKITLLGELKQTESSARYMGPWYLGHVTDPDPAYKEGDFEFQLE